MGESRPEPGGPVPAEPPFYIVTDRSIPPDEVHFRQDGKTVAVMKLGTGQVVAIPRRVDQTTPLHVRTDGSPKHLICGARYNSWLCTRPLEHDGRHQGADGMAWGER